MVGQLPAVAGSHSGQGGAAADRGDRPFGAVVVRNDTVVMTDSNRVVTEDDIRRHPELHLAFRARRAMTARARAVTAMYTSTEPCPMCAGGTTTAGFSHVVSSVSSEEPVSFTGESPAVRSAEVLKRVGEVVGPVMMEKGRAVHREFDW
ncbi:deaminase [Halorientalis pallida]|uniref:Nucleoside deaminase n=1 Tax=Halorientalis pallida TaxID=2479928 RepID=A0A498KY82_9EURY|nr:deaminase [Halorientalis pallida]RXK47902.1 nucleoside deaminase [Halorientalis pallida]